MDHHVYAARDRRPVLGQNPQGFRSSSAHVPCLQWAHDLTAETSPSGRHGFSAESRTSSGGTRSSGQSEGTKCRMEKPLQKESLFPTIFPGLELCQTFPSTRNVFLSLLWRVPCSGADPYQTWATFLQCSMQCRYMQCNMVACSFPLVDEWKRPPLRLA